MTQKWIGNREKVSGRIFKTKKANKLPIIKLIFSLDFFGDKTVAKGNNDTGESYYIQTIQEVNH